MISLWGAYTQIDGEGMPISNVSQQMVKQKFEINYKYNNLENCCFLSMAAIVELACVTGRISWWMLLFFGGGVVRRLGYMYLSDDSISDYPLVGWLKQQNKILPHISTHGGNVVLPAHGGSDLP